jgi:hypothetical protein
MTVRGVNVRIARLREAGEVAEADALEREAVDALDRLVAADVRLEDLGNGAAFLRAEPDPADEPAEASNPGDGASPDPGRDPSGYDALVAELKRRTRVGGDGVEVKIVGRRRYRPRFVDGSLRWSSVRDAVTWGRGDLLGILELADDVEEAVDVVLAVRSPRELSDLLEEIERAETERPEGPFAEIRSATGEHEPNETEGGAR